MNDVYIVYIGSPNPTEARLGSDLGTPPLQEGSEDSLLEIWSKSEERLSRFCGGQKGGELPSFD